MSERFDDWEGEHLQHYGVLGMKWGQRRFQNKDGSLTAAGKKHYEQTGEYGYTYKSHATKKYTKKAAKTEAKLKGDVSGKKAEKLSKKLDKYNSRAKKSRELDAREQEYANRVRVGGNIVSRMISTGLIGVPAGGKAYQQHLAMNKDTKSMGSKATALGMTYLGGRLGSAIRKANYIRQPEKAAKRAAKGKVDRAEAIRKKTAAAKQAFEASINAGTAAVKEQYNKKKKHSH